ncbi:oxidoreductase [Aliiglaciecola sp. CAU 1673]|uniref:oxidoreductase n=1 Tax=Aliiglaciecola sp. CAU 1673 TaxID=3032595 RepID=UPI0023DADA3A|nr:oxidoreductase [Aliiglaciecola sp. CAU 1673]MDF2178844.1 oxidoreductase [Aliiglaciecola sp. CAU 1673]
MHTDKAHPIKVAVVGYGLSAKVFHLPFIRCSPQFSLVALSTSQAVTAIELGDAMRFQSATEMIKGCQADLVVITAPNDQHFPLAKLALESGKDVVVEKPLVVSLEQGLALKALAERTGKKVFSYHNRRWDGDFMTLQKLIKDGKLGQVRLLESRFDRFRPEVQERWRESAGLGTGLLWDLGPHLIDQALVLFGLPDALSARCLLTREQAQAVDYFHLQLHYADKEVILHAGSHSAAPVCRFRAQGSLGEYVKYGLDPQEACLRAGILPQQADWAREAPDNDGCLYNGETKQSIPSLPGSYQHFYQGVADAMLHSAPSPVHINDAIVGIRLIELAIKSSETGTRLVVPTDIV